MTWPKSHRFVTALGWLHVTLCGRWTGVWCLQVHWPCTLMNVYPMGGGFSSWLGCSREMTLVKVIQDLCVAKFSDHCSVLQHWTQCNFSLLLGTLSTDGGQPSVSQSLTVHVSGNPSGLGKLRRLITLPSGHFFLLLWCGAQGSVLKHLRFSICIHAQISYSFPWLYSLFFFFFFF